MRTLGIFHVGSVLLNGCAAIATGLVIPGPRPKAEEILPPSTEERELVQLVRVYDSKEGLTYVSNDLVKGVTCMVKNEWTPALSGNTPEETAMWLLKLEVVRSGGTAVLSSACIHHQRVDWANNCWESWACEGLAVRVQ